MTLETIKKVWEDKSKTHVFINELFIEETNNDPDLKKLRDWVEENKWGFGERSFYWMWKLIVDQMPKEFYFLEIGVFRGQILALIELLAAKQGKKVFRYGISPMDSTEGYWDSNYQEDIDKIHEEFSLSKDYKVYKGLSTNPEIIELFKSGVPKFDIIYIDGGHDYETVKSDIKNYKECLLPDGYLVIDDSACRFKMPFGYFQGHHEVSRAVDELLPPVKKSKEFEHYFNVVHNRIWRKK